MEKIIGIDIGGSITKIIGLCNKQLFSPMLVKAADPVASIYGALGKFLSTNKLTLQDIDRIMITGVGSSFINEKLYGVPTGKVDEFRATALGGLFLTGFTKALIVSMGTGTAFVMADGNDVQHLGGTGVGGGTLLGLSNKMLNIRSFYDVIDIAKDGNLANVDLSVGDITNDMVKGLPQDTTASNFGKVSDLATKADTAFGIINLVFEVIGMLAVFAVRSSETKDIILTGNLSAIPQAKYVFDRVANLCSVHFHIPPNAEYATALGAAITFTQGIAFTDI